MLSLKLEKKVTTNSIIHDPALPSSFCQQYILILKQRVQVNRDKFCSTETNSARSGQEEEKENAGALPLCWDSGPESPAQSRPDFQQSELSLLSLLSLLSCLYILLNKSSFQVQSGKKAEQTKIRSSFRFFFSSSRAETPDKTTFSLGFYFQTICTWDDRPGGRGASEEETEHTVE